MLCEVYQVEIQSKMGRDTTFKKGGGGGEKLNIQNVPTFDDIIPIKSPQCRILGVDGWDPSPLPPP